MSETLVHVASGKVRELFTIDDERLLLVASDRISTFDVVLPTEIPDKGRVLTGLSAFWFARTREHLPEPPARAAARRPRDGVPAARDAPARVRRARLPRRLRLEGLPAQRGDVWATRLPDGLRESDRLPEAIFTPSTKATTGHDENIDARAGGRAGRRGPLSRRWSGPRSRSTASPPTTRAALGILIADTKFEFGVDAEGRLVLADEAFTPDSSRFWPADEYEPGGPQPSFDKQFVRDYCETLGWDKTDSGAGAPRRRRRRDAGALRRGVRAADRDRVRRLPRRPGGRAPVTAPAALAVRGRDEGDRARPPEGGDPRPAGTGGRGLAPPPRLRRRDMLGSAASSTSRSTPTTRRCPRRGRADVRAAAREPADRELRDRDRRTVSEPRPRSPSSSSPARTTTATRHGRSARSAPRPSSSGTGRTSCQTRRRGRAPRRLLVRRLPPLRRDRPLLAGAPGAVAPFAAEGGPVLGICNGFQILCEAGLLPGVLRPNESLSFVCRDVALLVERAGTAFTAAVRRRAAARRSPSSTARAAGSPRPSAGRAGARGPDRAPLRGRRQPERIDRRRRRRLSTAEGNVMGLMPHPEHAVDPLLGSADGALILASLVDAARDRAAARV